MKLKVSLIKSKIGCLPNQRATIEALGLGKLQSSVVHNDNKSIRGMIATVSHLVKVEELA